jgi:hypothetical protein
VALCTLALAAFAAGCGKTGERAHRGGPARSLEPVAEQGAVSVATRNTTRLGGADPPADAAAVARATYPALTTATRPPAVVLADSHNWQAALAASAMAGAPIAAPLLFSEGHSLPDVSRETLEALHPIGVASLNGAQVISVGAGGLPQGLVTRTVTVGEAAQTAAEIEQLIVASRAGHPPRTVLVVAAEAPEAMVAPAAGLAAESGSPILFVTASGVPAATASALSALGRPAIYIVDAAGVSPTALAQLRHLGAVTAVSAGAPTGVATAADAVANAIAVSRFTTGTFGWGVKEPGHGLVFANLTRPLDAPASARLSATGDYAPLLLLEDASKVPAELARYLSDIQPAYTSAPQLQAVRGVYNHGWLIGDESAIAAVTQAELDALLQISPRTPSPGEAAVAQSE